MDEMRTDGTKLEKMRADILAQVDEASGDSPLVAAQLAMQLRPVVAKLLGEGAEAEPPSSADDGGDGGGATDGAGGGAAPAPAPEGKKWGGFSLPWGRKK